MHRPTRLAVAALAAVLLAVGAVATGLTAADEPSHTASETFPYWFG
ncbi:MAG: hypothetical protein AAGD35_02360 [Actinomycetota bacterium]